MAVTRWSNGFDWQLFISFHGLETRSTRFPVFFVQLVDLLMLLDWLVQSIGIARSLWNSNKCDKVSYSHPD